MSLYVSLLILSFLNGGYCHLLITFEDILDPDQDQQNVGPDLDPQHLTLKTVILTDFFEKLIWKKNQIHDISKA